MELFVIVLIFLFYIKSALRTVHTTLDKGYNLRYLSALEQYKRKIMFNHITFNPEVLGGKPYIKGTRLSIEFIMELFASGATKAEILHAYPQLTPEAIEEALHYAAQATKNEILLTAQIHK